MIEVKSVIKSSAEQYDRNVQLKNNPELLSIELCHSYYNAGYIKGRTDISTKLYKAIDKIKQTDNFELADGYVYVRERDVVDIIRKCLEEK